MENKLIIVFGDPGAGKTFVSSILEKHFGYYSYNGDEALPEDMKQLIVNKSDVTFEMRERFVDAIIDTIHSLEPSNGKIVMHQALIKDHMRLQLMRAFPEAMFLWVQCDDAILKERYMKREYFNLGPEYLQVMLDAFEAPTHPYSAIDNSSEGSDRIVTQLRDILK